jgi:hypothetical protein
MKALGNRAEGHPRGQGATIRDGDRGNVRVRPTSPGIAYEGPVTQPDFAYKILGVAPYQGGAEKRNYEKFAGQSIDYGGAVGVPLGLWVPGQKIHGAWPGGRGPGERLMGEGAGQEAPGRDRQGAPGSL